MRLVEERWLKVVVSGLRPDQAKLSGKILISIPKKVVAKAVSRNRIKRVLRVAAGSVLKIDAGSLCTLRVIRNPKEVSLRLAKQALEKALS